MQIVFAQEKVNLSIGSASTTERQAALALGLKLFESYQSVLNTEQVAAGDNWYMYLAPQVDVKYGSSDVFNGFIAKGTGIVMFYENITVDGVTTDDDAKMKWVVPYSVGMETNKDFKNYNVIGEIGLIPSYKAIAGAKGITNKTLLQLCNYSNFGIYFQGGSKVGKVGTADSTSAGVGGDLSDSQETINGGISRLKVRANLAPVLLRSKTGEFKIHLKFEGTYWYDFLNKANYYRVEIKL